MHNFQVAYRFCPFAQRTWIALNEKKLTFDTHEVAIKDPETGLWKQLEEKPAWFTKLNPLGKVRSFRGNDFRFGGVKFDRITSTLAITHNDII